MSGVGQARGGVRESIPGRGNESPKRLEGESEQHHMKRKSKGQKCAGAGPQITAAQRNEMTSSGFHFLKVYIGLLVTSWLIIVPSL